MRPGGSLVTPVAGRALVLASRCATRPPAAAAPAAPPDAGEPAVSAPASLPLEIFESATRGELQKVVRWLRKGGLADAFFPTTSADGQPTTIALLQTAAAIGQLKMVRELLMYTMLTRCRVCS